LITNMAAASPVIIDRHQSAPITCHRHPSLFIITCHCCLSLFVVACHVVHLPPLNSGRSLSLFWLWHHVIM
jgi:hypothetical protein